MVRDFTIDLPERGDLTDERRDRSISHVTRWTGQQNKREKEPPVGRLRDMRTATLTKLSLLILCIGLAGSHARAQVVTSFSYQGSFNDGGVPANGQFDFMFKLYQFNQGGTQIGADFLRNDVPVTNGIFSTIISFGTTPFTSMTGLYIEVWVRPGASTGAYTALAPRIALQTTPYSLKSFDTQLLNGVPGSEYVQTTDARLSDARSPLPNSPSYIQNTSSQQASSNFNISGNGSAGGILSGNIINASTQFNIGGNRILSNPGSENLFAGVDAGTSNTNGIENSFFGRLAGANNTSGSGNSFFGFVAGRQTMAGTNNSFFGSRVGLNNFSGSFNSFFGHRAGEFNNGSVNSFFGTGAGLTNNSGTSNTFLGHDAGSTNTSGSFNTAVGENAGFSGNNLTNASAFGSKAFVSQSNSLILGSINGTNGATADTFVGIGTTAPTAKFHLSGTGIIRARINSDSNGGLAIALNEQSLWSLASVSPGHFQVFNDRIGQQALWVSTFDNSLNAGALNVGGIATLTALGNAGSLALCRNASNQISTCSSSLRYKQNVHLFGSGLDLVQRLSPITFDWKTGGARDLGLGAEEVAKIEPLLVTLNEKGEVEGVKYDRVAIVLINAVKEQQVQIEQQRELIESQQRQVTLQTDMMKEKREWLERQQGELVRQRSELEALKKFVCTSNPTADVCQPNKQF